MPANEYLRRILNARVYDVATETPLRWSGKLLKKSEVWNRFVFAAKLQVRHINGLTYDFLYETARELEQKDSLLLVGAGPKANQPLVFQRGGTPYRGFLEGRTRGESYCLILHLSNMELKLPEKAAGKSEYNGTTYYFCGRGCYLEFTEDPEGYLSGKKKMEM